MSLALQRFEGTSIEAALGAAVQSLGAGLRVREAKRVRRGGVLGFFAREHYEVIAEGGVAVDLTRPPELEAVARVDDALRALVEEVESREEPPALPPAPSRFTELDLVPLDEPAVAIAPTPLYDFEVLDAEPVEQLPRWTRKALREMGMPAVILRSLPQRPPTSDEGWTKALARAIARHVPPPVVPGGAACVQVTGRGDRAAVQLIRAGVAGFPPGLLHLEDETVPATPAVLAEAVRACLPR